ncbi:MAG: LON peptidase substrate-binding domain-containing protein [Dehalococcoidia bacterium]
MTTPPSRELPLFPLNVVLFPGMVLPLMVFEERYKLMMKDCLEGDRSFGVVLIKSGKEVGGPALPFDVGTRARIVDVIPRGEGRMSLTAVGNEVFRILEMTRQTPYVIGQVEYLERKRSISEEASGLAARVRSYCQTYASLLSALMGDESKELKLEDDPEKLSYMVASTLRTGMRRKQGLLETPSTVDRLKEELQILQEENLTLQLFLSEKQRSEGGEGKGRGQPRFSPN